MIERVNVLFPTQFLLNLSVHHVTIFSPRGQKQQKIKTYHNMLVRTTSSVSGPFPNQVFPNRKSWFLPKQRVTHWKYWCARCAFWFFFNARRNLIILHHLKPKPLYTLTSVSIFSILFSVQFLWYWQGEFVWQSKLLELVIICLILVILRNDLALFL